MVERQDATRCAGCCSYPNGGLSVLTMIFAIIAYGLAMFTIYGCHYVDVDLSKEALAGLPAETDFGFGLWSREHHWWFDEEDKKPSDWDDWENYACHNWKDADENEFFDGNWRAARVMGQLSTTIGFIMMILTFSMMCVGYSRLVLKIYALFTFLAGLLILLTLVALASDICDRFDCQFSHSAGTAIAAGVMYFLTACVMLATPQATNVDKESNNNTANRSATVVPDSTLPPAGSVVVTETVLPDGTKKTVRTTTNPDGSKTVHETVQTPIEEAPQPIIVVTGMEKDDIL